ncbi:hypothetical protein E4U23_007981 [Claviceps purpurea]|nr:hypothetical protein E4U23_007981 [Claviceps purpurea]
MELLSDLCYLSAIILMHDEDQAGQSDKAPDESLVPREPSVRLTGLSHPEPPAAATDFDQQGLSVSILEAYDQMIRLRHIERFENGLPSPELIGRRLVMT